nr:MAG TPA: hypothetical protein [Caudoviricetes sp.]
MVPRYPERSPRHQFLMCVKGNMALKMPLP